MHLRPADTAVRQAQDIDARYHPSAALRRQLNKVFPTHWSFLLGEIALYSFVVLLITGIYLTLFFDPSMIEVPYHGVYQPLRGVEMSRAYESALNISFEVRGGLFVRQVHHWAALMFAASIMVHLARVFFTGAFRRPREANWVIGSLLLILAMFEGYFGYSLPDDLLSGIGLRCALSSIMLGFPVIGTWLHWAFFGGDFPGTALITRLYALHVLVLPAIILALIGAHLAMVWFQKHTQFPGPGRTECNVVGVRVMPIFAVKSGAFFALTTGVLGLMGGLLQINPIWNLGPYQPSHVSAGSQPDFYMMWTEGLQRLWPAWEIYVGHHTVPAAVGAAMIMGIVFVLLTIYPFLEKRFSGDYAHHNLLQRPRDVPVRTGIGAMAIAFYLVLTLGAMNDIIALKFHISLNATTWVGRIGMVVLPPIVYFITYRWCVGLQRSDRVRPRARHRNRHPQAVAARRLRRTAPATRTVTAEISGRSGANENEQARLRRLPRLGQFPVRGSRRRRHRTIRGPSRRRAPRAHRAAGSLKVVRSNEAPSLTHMLRDMMSV